jgi:hypothetical protein
VQSDIEALKTHTSAEAIAAYPKDALDVVCKIKWADLAQDPDQCRAQVVRFCECARERNTNGLVPEEKQLYEKQQTTWKWVSKQKDQENLLSLFDLLPKGRIRTVERVSLEIFQTVAEQHQEFKAGLPRLLKPGEKRGDDEVYHFLVFDPEMVPTRSDALMKSFWKDNCAAAADWVKKQVTPKWKKDEISEALAVCKLIDTHWHTYAQQRAAALAATACTATVWPTPSNSPEALAPGPPLAEQEKVCRDLESTSSSFQRLRLVMDTWCGLWFWPLERVGDLPSRDAFLASTRLLLSGERPDKAWVEMLTARLGFEVDVLLNAAPEGEVPDTLLLAGAVPWFGVATTIRDEQSFHHWELVFVEVLAEHSTSRGFDWILGNPPWKRADWEKSSAAAELNPILGVRDADSASLDRSLPTLLNVVDNRIWYCKTYTRALGTKGVLGAARNYADLVGTRPNYYKNFICQGWNLLCNRGIVALLHPIGPFLEPALRHFRSIYYHRLRAHLHFRNEMLLFSEVDNHEEYSINVSGSISHEVHFRSIFNLFHPTTASHIVSQSYSAGPPPGIKTNENKWNTTPHSSRWLEISFKELKLFSLLMENGSVPPEQARMLQVHSNPQLHVLEKMAKGVRWLPESRNDICGSTMFNETNAKRSGELTKSQSPTCEPKRPEDWVICGPHIFVASPFNKSARQISTHNKAYDRVDLLSITEDFLPRSVYSIGNAKGDSSAYQTRIEKWQFEEKPLVSYYRHVNREMVQSGLERTLVSAVVPPGPCHIYTAFSLVFRDVAELVAFSGACSSIVFDYLIKQTGTRHVQLDTLRMLPKIEAPYLEPIRRRALRMNCLTAPYADLWAKVYDGNMREDNFTSNDPRLFNEDECPWGDLPQDWNWGTALRRDFSRRQALIELDVLVAMSIGLSLDELIAIYRSQFPVMRWYDSTDLYDSTGKVLPNAQRPDNQGGQNTRDAVAESNGEGPISVEIPFDGGDRTVNVLFQPPFERLDREAEYGVAYKEFTKRYGGQP